MIDDQAQALEEQVARIRESGVLGNSQGLVRLLDYLAAGARSDRAIHETDVAQDVFNRIVDLSGDASVRVYVHRLRKKLEAFYAGPGAHEEWRLTIPRGDYRLHLERNAPAGGPTPAAAKIRRHHVRLAALASVILVNGLGWFLFAHMHQPDRMLAAVIRTPVWSAIAGERPALVVIGDYYIFGELSGNSFDVDRMIRDFDINDRDELDQYLMVHPDQQERYVDLNTTYAPTGATLALRHILPVVLAAKGSPDRVRVITASQLQPEMLKTADIVYVGYLSGLRMLERPVFAGARLEVGMSYDQLVDTQTHRSFTSQAGQAKPDQPNQDYGYLRVMPLPEGNHIVAIAGTRDIGLEKCAELATDPRALARIRADARGRIEQLYDVRGIGRTVLGARPVELPAVPRLDK